METCLEKLTDDARNRLESIKTEFPNYYQIFIKELSHNYGYNHLKLWVCVDLMLFLYSRPFDVRFFNSMFKRQSKKELNNN